MPDQKTMQTRGLGGFFVMWVTKLLISLVKNWRFCSFWARPCWLIWCPVGGLVGGCGAGCISQDTYLLYIISWQLWLFYISVLQSLQKGEPRPRQIREWQHWDNTGTKDATCSHSALRSVCPIWNDNQALTSIVVAMKCFHFLKIIANAVWWLS